MEIEMKSETEGIAAQARVPLGLIAAGVLVADALGIGHPVLTKAAVLVVASLQVLLSISYVVLLWRTKQRHIPGLYGWSLMRRYLYVCGFGVVYASTGHWWLAAFQVVVLLTLTLFVVEHKKG